MSLHGVVTLVIRADMLSLRMANGKHLAELLRERSAMVVCTDKEDHHHLLKARNGANDFLYRGTQDDPDMLALVIGNVQAQTETLRSQSS